VRVTRGGINNPKFFPARSPPTRCRCHYRAMGIIPSAGGIRFVKRDEQGQARWCVRVLHPYAHDVWRLLQVVLMPWLPEARPHPPCYQRSAVPPLRGLKYASQSEASYWRAQRKALSIRHRLGASGEALGGPFPPKPQKMRWATYERLRAADAALQEQWLLGAAGDLGRLNRRVKRR